MILVGHVLMGMRYDYMTEDQRFSSTRPDALVYKSKPLDHDVTIAGPITVDLKVSTTGTDSDFDVKLIDVYPGNFPDYAAATDPMGTPTPATLRTQPANTIQLGGYQQLVRGEPFTGRVSKRQSPLNQESRIGLLFKCRTFCIPFAPGIASWSKCKAPGSR